jgi:hypothetical protein
LEENNLSLINKIQELNESCEKTEEHKRRVEETMLAKKKEHEDNLSALKKLINVGNSALNSLQKKSSSSQVMEKASSGSS